MPAPVASVLPTDTIVHFTHGPQYVAPSGGGYVAPAAASTFIAPAGGVSEAAIHGVGIGVNVHA